MRIPTGLLQAAKDDASLAFVLAHELGHYLLRHDREDMRQRELRKKLKGRLFFTVPIVLCGLANPTFRARSKVILPVAAFLTMYNSISRIQSAGIAEIWRVEADEVGLLLTAAAGYDPAAAMRLVGMLPARRCGMHHNDAVEHFVELANDSPRAVCHSIAFL